MARHATRIPHPKGQKAEGWMNGVPFDTWITSASGCGVHFWLGDNPDLERARTLGRQMRDYRDVVEVTFSHGEPAGFWAKTCFGHDLDEHDRCKHCGTDLSVHLALKGAGLL